MYNNKLVVVVNAGNKILRENNGEVLIPFGSEYSISVKNLNDRKALVNISVDGDDVLDGSRIIISPNKTTTLEGFMRDSKVSNRFKFIEKTDEISDFRGDKIEDGLISVSFQLESPLNEMATWWSNTHVMGGPYVNGNGMYDGGYSRGITPTSGNPVYGSPTLGSSSINCCADATPKAMASSCFAAQSYQPETESGITVKGSQSDQVFNRGSIGVLDYKVHTMIIHLKGLTKNNSAVSQPVFVKSKVQCESCGRKWKSNNQFCGNCGTSLV